MKKNLTITDIAQMAGVGKSTVSRYFNGGYVKESTKEKIQKVIDEHHYQPNAFARLKAKKSHIIGVIAPCLDSSVASRVLMGIDEVLQAQGYTSLIINTNHDSAQELKSMTSLYRMKVDGIIINATVVTDEHYTLAKQFDIPVIFIGQRYTQGVSIINDDTGAGVFLTDYLIKKGHQDVLVVTVDEQDEAVGIIRKQAICDTLDKHHISYRTCISDYSFTLSKTVIKDALQSHLPSVILCSSTKQLLASYHCVKELGLRIPEDISICGFGGYEYSEVLSPSLTSIQFDAKLSGNVGAKTMLSMINEEDVETTQMIPFEFHEGNSVLDKMKG